MEKSNKYHHIFTGCCLRHERVILVQEAKDRKSFRKWCFIKLYQITHVISRLPKYGYGFKKVA